MVRDGSLLNIPAGVIDCFARKPIRVFLQDGVNDLRSQNDLDLDRDWHLQYQAMVAALSEKIYNMDYVFGEGGHSDDQGGAILPEMLQCKNGPIPKEAKQ